MLPSGQSKDIYAFAQRWVMQMYRVDATLGSYGQLVSRRGRLVFGYQGPAMTTGVLLLVVVLRSGSGREAEVDGYKSLGSE